jgi:hypothetical protein
VLKKKKFVENALKKTRVLFFVVAFLEKTERINKMSMYIKGIFDCDI